MKKRISFVFIALFLLCATENVFSQGTFANENPEAMFYEGLSYLEGEKTDENLNKALDRLVNSAELGYAKAQRYIAAFFRGKGENTKARFWELKASAQDFELDDFNFGKMLGLTGVGKTNPALYENFLKFYGLKGDEINADEITPDENSTPTEDDKKIMNGLYAQGMGYLSGTEINLEKALQCFGLAASMHHPEALNLMGELWYEGEIFPENLEIALMYFIDGTIYGSNNATKNLVFCLENGYGITKNERLANVFRKLIR